MTCIIAIETATEACSAALLIDKEGDATLFKRFQLAPREHTKLILPMLDQVLGEAELKLYDVDAIAFGRGPGAFTGLRIATGVVQGLALSVDKPTIPVSSLTAMALTAKKETNFKDIIYTIIVAIDARMGEVYWAEYKVNGNELTIVGEEQLSQPDKMFTKTATNEKINAVALIGSGWDEYLEEFQKKHMESKNLQHLKQRFPDAEEISQLALIAFKNDEYQSVEDAQPVYLRNNVAVKSQK